MITVQEKKTYRIFAEKLVQEAGHIVKMMKKDFKIRTVKGKEKIDIATTADYASEDFLISQIKKTYPSHGIFAEESGENYSQSDFRWVIDPLDGTKEYARKIPYYYVLLALEYNGELVASAAYQPETNYLFSADIKSYLNSYPITVSKESDLSKSFISVRLPSTALSKTCITHSFTIMSSLCHTSYKIRSTQWDAESLAYVAMGAYDGFVSLSSKKDRAHYKLWDVAPGILMVRSAGGVVTDMDGNEQIENTISNGLVASNGILHKKLLQIIKETKNT